MRLNLVCHYRASGSWFNDQEEPASGDLVATIAVTRRFDLTDAQWTALEPLLPKGKKPGRLLATMPQELQRAAGGWHAEWRPLRELLTVTGSAGGSARLAAGLDIRPSCDRFGYHSHLSAVHARQTAIPLSSGASGTRFGDWPAQSTAALAARSDGHAGAEGRGARDGTGGVRAR
jgi:hypothetical protein